MLQNCPKLHRAAQGQLERSSYGYCSQMIIQCPSRKVLAPEKQNVYVSVGCICAGGGDNEGGSA